MRIKESLPSPGALVVIFLLLCLVLSLLPVNATKAKVISIAEENKFSDKDEDKSENRVKISPEITDYIQNAQSKSQKVKKLKVIVQLNKRLYRGRTCTLLSSLLANQDIKVYGDFDRLHAGAIEVSPDALAELASYDVVSYISLDKDVELLGHLETTSGAAVMRSLSGNNNVDGRGIGIAILDSSLFDTHNSFLTDNDTTRIVYQRDFTGAGINGADAYGHGTHVAGIAAGGADEMDRQYRGIAPGANLINLRVLDSQGRGNVSTLLSAFNWILTNRLTYNIRVVNMSLGAFAVDSYLNDPLCMTVRRLVDAGIVCVAAAGNNGKTSDGQKVYGLIHSPGNEPSAITVGATNTKGTDGRNDDVIATYSSRGPTRSYRTDANGIKHYDNLIKPDVVASGNKIVAAEAAGNLLVTQNPQLDATKSGDLDNPEKRVMMLNGTSMAAPVVAGTVALMLQVNPNLTPNLVKIILMYTAQPLAGFNMLEQGAGEVNIEGAVRLAKLVRVTNSATSLGTPLLTSSRLPTPQTTIADQTFTWGQGIILDYTYAAGSEIISKYQRVYGFGFLLGDATVMSDSRLLCDNTMVTNGMLLGDNLLISNGMLLCDGTVFLSDGMLLDDGLLLGDGMLLSDGMLLGDGMLLNDGYLLGDAMTQSYSAMINGDSGLCADCPRH